MSVARTARRRRSQAKARFMHMPPQTRPCYRKRPRKNAGMRLRAAIARGFKG